MKAIAETLGVARPNLARADEAARRHRRPPGLENELVAAIKAVIAEMPTYGYRRVHAILKRQAQAAGHRITSASIVS